MAKYLIFITLLYSNNTAYAEHYIFHSKPQSFRITPAPHDKEKILINRNNRTEICEWADRLNRPIHCKLVRPR